MILQWRICAQASTSKHGDLSRAAEAQLEDRRTAWLELQRNVRGFWPFVVVFFVVCWLVAPIANLVVSDVCL